MNVTPFSRLWRCEGVAGGAPCIRTTGVMAVIVAKRFLAGESVLTLAGEYGVTAMAIEDALRLVIHAHGTSLRSKRAEARVAAVVPITRRQA